MTRPSLAGIEQRAAAATPGPWFEDDDGGVSTEPTSERIVDTEGCGMHEDNRALIAHARTDLPALTAAVRDVLAIIAEFERLPEATLRASEAAHLVRLAFVPHLDLTDPEGDPR